ncbi:MAG TPA: ATP phosphoribosyltransferase regulatory subunit [Coriobacteriia bacterium]|nr:ATP phosphoribosyltransferase regulatory subunit [Coriobacteriia bacterium]
MTPRGFRDVLPEEAAEREALIARIGDTLGAWGYGRVETPVVERLETLEAAAGSLEGTAFRLVDLDGRLLALRPDLTVPIARLVSSRLAEQPGPFRLRYVADAFREHESLRGQARQFTQIGVELIGTGGPAADAEVVALLVEALRAAGLGRFTVAVGSVEVFSAILEAAEMDDTWIRAVMDAAHDRNLVELARLSDAPGVAPAAGAALRAVPRIRGSRSAIDECRAAVVGCGCDDALDSLAETFDLLEAAGAAEEVMVDFSLMRSFGYYTGIVVEAYAPGVGVPLGGGGRYDRVLERFGLPAPAAGFALGLERLSIALIEQGVAVPVRGLDAVIGGEPADALAAAARLRAAGWRVVLTERTGLEVVREADRGGATEALIARGEQILRLDRAGELSLALGEPLPYPPTTSWAEGGEEL